MTMERLSPRSLRAKLQIFSVLLIVGPGVVFGMIAYTSARSALERAVGRQLAEVAHDVVDELVEAVRSELRDLHGWARQDFMRDVIAGDVDKRVSRFLRSLTEGDAPAFLDLLCVDLSGRVVAASDLQKIAGLAGDRDAVRTALAGKEFLEGPAALVDHGPLVIELAVPIFDSERRDRVIGALIGHFDWSRAIKRVDHIRASLLPHGLAINVLILDRANEIIGQSWRGKDEAPEDEAPKVRLALVDIKPRLPFEPGRGSLTLTSDTVSELVGYERGEDPRSYWLALAMQPLDEALAPVHAMQWRLGMALATVLLGALGLATIWATRMSRPLRDLTLATQVVARAGEAPPPVAVRSRDEIGTLADAFNAMAAALARAQRDLLSAAKFAFVGEVAAGVAHEVRTPLGIMRSSAQMLVRTLPPGQAESIELAEMIVGEVDRLDRVVAGLLEIARPREPVLESVPLAPILARVLEFVGGQASQRGITIVREFAAPQMPARCDPEQIYQVALNLVVNALQILPAGGSITVRTFARLGDRVGFEVSDDGPGIPQELRQRIFTPFFSCRPGGTGLGLALVQRMVEEHHGTVTVDSAIGRGTTFRVELPIAGETQ